MNKHIQEVPIFESRLTIITAKNFKKAVKKYKINCLPKSFVVDDCVAFTCGEPHNYYILIKPDASANTIAHEAVHLVNYLFIDKDISHNKRNDETQAYLTGWFVEQIQKQIKRHPSYKRGE